MAPEDRITSPRAEPRRAAGHERVDADAAQAVEHQARHLRIRRDRQVGALARARIEIADRRRDAPLVEVGDGDRIVSVAPFAVLVGDEVEARLAERLGDRLGVLGPEVGEDAADRDAALASVPARVLGRVEVHVALDPLEEREHVVPRPSARAAPLPLVVVAWRAAIGQLAVDRGAAAQHARLLVFAQPRARRVGAVVRHDFRRDLELGPVEARVEIGGAGIGIEDFGRHLAMRRVRTRLAQQHRVIGARGEPVGEHRAGRPAAHDDGVVALPPSCPPPHVLRARMLYPATGAQPACLDRSLTIELASAATERGSTSMGLAELPRDGLVAVVKRDCPTCVLTAPVLEELARLRPMVVITQDDPAFPDAVPVRVHDAALDVSHRLKVEIVPTLIRMEGGREVGAHYGWDRAEWQRVAAGRGNRRRPALVPSGVRCQEHRTRRAGAAEDPLRRDWHHRAPDRDRRARRTRSRRCSSAAGRTACRWCRRPRSGCCGCCRARRAIPPRSSGSRRRTSRPPRSRRSPSTR